MFVSIWLVSVDAEGRCEPARNVHATKEARWNERGTFKFLQTILRRNVGLIACISPYRLLRRLTSTYWGRGARDFRIATRGGIPLWSGRALRHGCPSGLSYIILIH